MTRRENIVIEITTIVLDIALKEPEAFFIYKININSDLAIYFPI